MSARPRPGALAGLAILGFLAAAALEAGGALGAQPERPAPAVPDTLASVPADTVTAAPGEAAPAAPAPPAPPAPAAAAVPAQGLVIPGGVDPTLAVVMTPVWPGWGQLYTGDGWRAALAFGVQTLYLTRLLMNDRKAVRAQEFAATLELPEFRERYAALTEEYRERVRDFAWWSAGGMLIIALDAYVNAHLHRFGQDPVPVPTNWRTLPENAAGRSTAGPEGMVFWSWSMGF